MQGSAEKQNGKSSKKPWTRSPEEIRKIRAMVQECLDMFPMYKEPEAAASILARFLKVLGPYKISDIEKAFDRWFETKTTMPFPAEILALMGAMTSDWEWVEDPQGNHWHSGKRWLKVNKRTGAKQ